MVVAFCTKDGFEKENFDVDGRLDMMDVVVESRKGKEKRVSWSCCR